MIISAQLRYVALIYILISFIASLDLTIGDDNLKCIESERQALLSFKSGVKDSSGMLFSWRNEDENCCNWTRVKCDNFTNHIIQLHLPGSIYLEDEEPHFLRGKIGVSLIELSHLQHLDLSYNGLEDGPIPDYIGSFVELVYLNLSYNSFSGIIPPQLGNLSSLHTLDLHGYWNMQPSSKSLEWLSGLTALQHLDLSQAKLQNASDWMEAINKLPHLQTLILSDCSLPPLIFPSYPYINISTSLSKLDLRVNQLTSSIFSWVSNFSTSLNYLDLSYNNLQGSIPKTFENMTLLSYIDFSSNKLTEGASPNSFWNFCNLHTLTLYDNALKGTLSDFLQILPKCALNSLQELGFFWNKFSGQLPDFSLFPNLKKLDLSFNNFSGTIPVSLGQLSYMEELFLYGNSFEGIILEAHFLKLTKLRKLYLSGNSLSFQPHSHWVPPFQLDYIDLSNCRLGPKFPLWLHGQNLTRLGISNAGIFDTVPQWLWDLFPNEIQLDLSENKIKGRLPTLSKEMGKELNFINLRSNEFEGQVPSFLSQAQWLDVSKNKFSGLNFVCEINEVLHLYHLDISHNQFLEEVPNCWENLSTLMILNLASCNISGGIPNSLSNLRGLKLLDLHNNSFSGEFPSWLKNFNNLKFLNLEGNNLSGPIPTWIGNMLPNLTSLSLRSNQFYGQLPSSICHLQRLQRLDLSLNNITGTIPNCIHNFTCLTVNSFCREQPNYLHLVQPNQLEMVMMWKGRENVIKENLPFVKSIDLSGNRLTGTIPNEIIKLVELIFVNLSRNNLMGRIPEKIGQLKSLDFLDLSRNGLVGHIPSSLSEINGLSVLDLSYNNLSGKIPIGTQLQSFNPSAYEGNTELCGSPLPKCAEEEIVPDQTEKNEEAKGNEFATRGFYISLAVGFVVGFWGISGSLMLHRPWRHAYFGFLGGLNDWFYVKIAIFRNKVQRRFRE